VSGETAQEIMANQLRKNVKAIRAAVIKEETAADGRAIRRLLVESVVLLQEQIDQVVHLLPSLPPPNHKVDAPSFFLLNRLAETGRLGRTQWLEAVARQADVFVKTMRQRGLSHKEVDKLDRLLGMEPNKE
jgi:hypothetical protein